MDTKLISLIGQPTFQVHKYYCSIYRQKLSRPLVKWWITEFTLESLSSKTLSTLSVVRWKAKIWNNVNTLKWVQWIKKLSHAFNKPCVDQTAAHLDTDTFIPLATKLGVIALQFNSWILSVILGLSCTQLLIVVYGLLVFIWSMKTLW